MTDRRDKAAGHAAERQSDWRGGQLGVECLGWLVACCDQITCSLSCSRSGSELGRSEW